jgi:dihydroflavonol-4-reductase
VNGTENIIAACRGSNVKRLVYISSVHAIPVLKHGDVMSETDTFDPDLVTGQYSKTKAAATRLVLKASEEVAGRSRRSSSGIIGPDGPTNSMTHLVRSLLKGRLPAAVRGGYDFVDVRTWRRGAISAADRGRTGQCYILSGRYIDMCELLDTLSEVSGARRIRTFLPIWFLKATAPLAELYYRLARQQPLFTAYSLQTISDNALFSKEKAARELGFEARPIEETLRDTVRWVCDNDAGCQPVKTKAGRYYPRGRGARRRRWAG